MRARLALLLLAEGSALFWAEGRQGRKQQQPHEYFTRFPLIAHRQTQYGVDGYLVENSIARTNNNISPHAGRSNDLPGLGCFPEDGTVQVENQTQPVLMRNLRIGDNVLTADYQYAPIYAFGHRLTEHYDIFVQLETKKENLQLTGEHLIYLNGKSNPVRADSIQSGDVLRGGTKVMDTSLVVRQGVYAPLTTSGTLIVNGFAVSSYFAIQSHATEHLEFSNGRRSVLSQQQFIHMGLSPLRMACLGASPSFCSHDNPQGRPKYLSWLLLAKEFVENQPHWVQSTLLFLYVIIMRFCVLLEGLVGASKVTSTLALLAIVYCIGRALRLQLRIKIIHPQR